MKWFSRLFKKSAAARQRDQIKQSIMAHVPLEIVNAILRDNPEVEPEIGIVFYKNVLISGDKDCLLKELKAAAYSKNTRKVQAYLQLAGQSIVWSSQLLCSVDSPVVQDTLSHVQEAVSEGRLEDIMDTEERQRTMRLTCAMLVIHCVQCIRRALSTPFRQIVVESLHESIKAAQDILSKTKTKSQEAFSASIVLFSWRDAELTPLLSENREDMGDCYGFMDAQSLRELAQKDLQRQADALRGIWPCKVPVDREAFIFQLSGRTARTIDDLVSLCEAHPNEAARHLVEGHFAAWSRMPGHLKCELAAIEQEECEPQSALKRFIDVAKRRTVKQRVITVTARVLGLDESEIEPQHEFVTDLGAGDVQLAKLAVTFMEEFGIGMDVDAALSLQTVGGAVEFITSTCREQGIDVEA